MEKTGSFETVVYKEDGKLMMRLPGGEIKVYDNRFHNHLPIKEGDQFVKTKEDEDGSEA